MFRFVKSWFGGESSSRSRRPSPRSVRLGLEALEDRFVPSTLTVFNTADSGAGSLRNAVNQANIDSQHGRSDTIAFNGSLNGRTIYLNTPLILDGGQGTITINGTGNGPLLTGKYDAFAITRGTTVNMNNVVVAGCHGSTHGGDVANGGTLKLHNCVFENSSAVAFGGAIYNTGNLTMSNCACDGVSASVSGGAIFNLGTVNVYDCEFDYDSAGYGGAIYNDKGSTLYVLSQGNKFEQDKATKGDGGAIYNAGRATVYGSDFSSNSTVASGGAIANFGNIYVDNNVNCYHNHADYYGGGFYDGAGAPWHFYAHWNGNSAGKQGPNFYIEGGKAG